MDFLLFSLICFLSFLAISIIAVLDMKSYKNSEPYNCLISKIKIHPFFKVLDLILGIIFFLGILHYGGKI